MLRLALRSAPLVVAASSRARPLRARAAAMASSDGPALPQGSAPAQNFFRDQVYVGAKAQGRRVPWDIGAPQPALASVAASFTGSVFDVGAGLGDNAIWLASLPGVARVTAVDISPDAVAEAAARLASASPQPHAPVAVTLADVFALPAEMTAFDALLDSAVFHCIGDDDAQRRYLAAVTPRVKLGGKAVMLVFSDANADPWMGPRRISAAHARQVWTDAGWRVDSLSEDVYYRDSMGRNDGKGGHALLMVATRTA